MELAINYLKEYKKQIDPIIEKVFMDLETEATQISPIAKDAAERYHRFMLGGKKHRGALTKFGYELFNSEINEDVLKASLAIEITHAFALIHDDVMDQDILRRKNPTVHKQYEKSFETILSKDENRHYAESMAYTLGDLGMFLGQLILNKLDFPPDRRSKAITHYVGRIMEVVYGQLLDVSIGIDKPATEKDVLLIHRYKTGDYSGSLPMIIGAILAGADDEKLNPIYEYGWRIGTAYQIRDDEIGLFGEEDEIGKPVGSDIRQNKNTLLKVKAIENASETDRQFLNEAYGNNNIEREGIERVRQITRDAEAFDYSHTICKKMVNEAYEYIPQITDNKHHQELMRSAGKFMIERTS